MKILLVCHESLIPRLDTTEKKAEVAAWRTEYYVASSLLRLGHAVQFCGLHDSLDVLRKALRNFKPDLVFNLLEEFAGEGTLEPLLVSFLENEKICFTGCSSESLILCKNKVATKKILEHAGVRVPRSDQFPKIVKYVAEESSFGITDRAVVLNKKQEKKRFSFLREKYKSAVFSEEFIDGKELQVGLLPLGKKILHFKIWQTSFGKKNGPHIMTEQMKWNFSLRKKLGVKMGVARGLTRTDAGKIRTVSEKVVRSLNIDGPVRIDFRWSKEKGPVVIEVNPNPDLARWDEYALAARASNISYDNLIKRILAGALKR